MKTSEFCLFCLPELLRACWKWYVECRKCEGDIKKWDVNVEKQDVSV